jgi:hypothetical protein
MESAADFFPAKCLLGNSPGIVLAHRQGALLRRAKDADPDVVKLTPEQKASVEAGLADIDAGRVVTDEELARRDAAEWR